MTTKIQAVEKLVSRKSGATLEHLQDATGWQPHSVRAAITGLRKKGLTVLLSQTTKGKKIYKATKE
jgi:hypothetical protein